jgi:hypothetical protein
LKTFQNKLGIQVLMARTCNPSYSGDRDQEDHSSKSSGQ